MDVLYCTSLKNTFTDYVKASDLLHTIMLLHWWPLACLRQQKLKCLSKSWDSSEVEAESPEVNPLAFMLLSLSDAIAHQMTVSCEEWKESKIWQLRSEKTHSPLQTRHQWMHRNISESTHARRLGLSGTEGVRCWIKRDDSGEWISTPDTRAVTQCLV